jgi:hypothetical protein
MEGVEVVMVVQILQGVIGMLQDVV